MAEGARLESVFRATPNVGSNPTLSAIPEIIPFEIIHLEIIHLEIIHLEIIPFEIIHLEIRGLD